ncbi:choline transporter-like protein 1 [Eurytemora carolleeae]|uniref:choline transporter-like protein 1 n=1 Tax=Eurytemora carolleeae TaxID=1294199 RepID=UPI000C76D2B4|nr:choline transporter-like protein 1 [Eurytemora carolleeae]|eukprot:XP_023339526.1 choline transporter-like protein 1 [Eurytemora affinis]
MAAIALVLSLLMTMAFRFLAKVIVYVIIGVVVVGCIAGTVLLWVLWYLKDQDIKLQAAEESKPNNQSAIMNTTEQITRNFLGSSSQANSQAEVNYFLAGAIIATVVTAVILLILLVLRKRIQLVVQLFKEAGAAVHAMPLLVFAPFATVVLQAIVGVSWIYGTLWIESSGYPQKVNSTGFITYTKDLTILWMRW